MAVVGRTLAIGLLLIGATASAQTLYGARGGSFTASDLFILDPADGSIITTAGPIGFAISGLAIDPNSRVLYGSTSNNSAASPRSLIRINRMTGAGTLIGAFGVGGAETMADLAFAPDGTLFGAGSAQNLYTIDTNTGAATLIGNNGNGSGLGNALEANAGGTFYYAGDPNGADGDLYTQDPSNAALTSIASLSGAPGDPENAIAALSFAPNGSLFAVVLDTVNAGEARGTAYLTIINIATGAVQNLGGTVTFLDAIAFASPRNAVPAVANPSLLVIAALLGALGMHRIRRRARS
jgi:hypothetical protein